MRPVASLVLLVLLAGCRATRGAEKASPDPSSTAAALGSPPAERSSSTVASASAEPSVDANGGATLKSYDRERKRYAEFGYDVDGVRIRDAATHAVLLALEIGYVESAVFSPDGRTLYVGTQHYAPCAYDLTVKAPKERCFDLAAGMGGNGDPSATRLALSDDGSTSPDAASASASASGIPRRESLPSGRRRRGTPTLSSSTGAPSWSPAMGESSSSIQRRWR
jgi:hypothetical protein